MGFLFAWHVSHCSQICHTVTMETPSLTVFLVLNCPSQFLTHPAQRCCHCVASCCYLAVRTVIRRTCCCLIMDGCNSRGEFWLKLTAIKLLHSYCDLKLSTGEPRNGLFCCHGFRLLVLWIWESANPETNPDGLFNMAHVQLWQVKYKTVLKLRHFANWRENTLTLIISTMRNLCVCVLDGGLVARSGV